MKIKKINNSLGRLSGFAPLFIRFIVGFHLVYLTRNAVLDPGKLKNIIDFFDTEKIPFPAFTAPLTVYTEFACGVLLMLGLFTRLAAAVLVFVFICAIAIVHIPDTYFNTFPALVMLGGSVSLLFSGAGKLSADRLFFK